MRVLALTSYPNRAARTRFRVSAYGALLAERGITLSLSSMLDDPAFARFYEPGHRLRKGWQVARGTLRQLGVAATARPDVVLVQREALLVGGAWVEGLLARLRGVPLVFDFDDAIWVEARSPRHPVLASLLKAPRKTWDLVAMAREVTVGSHYLAEQARRRHPRVSLLPTVVSRETWRPAARPPEREVLLPSRPVVIGWIGTHTTAAALRLVAPALRRLQAEGRPLRVRLVGAAPDFRLEGVEVELVPWSLERELQNFHALDIGLGPVLDTEFSRGKCAFKQLQYMAAGVPVVSSPGGGAEELLRDGVDALIARSEDQWYDALRRLLDDAPLRQRLSQQARQRVETELCLEAQVDVLAEVLRRAARAR